MSHPLFFAGEGIPPQAQPLSELPLLVLVGLTGVGKSSLLQQLAFATLPDRREVVDRYVLPLFGATPPLDRVQRFELTRRFRQEYPGGVAHALANGYTLPTWPLIFDGLRGEDEVRFALEHLPLARFVVLQASDVARLGRLLNRGDAFDWVRAPSTDLHALQSMAQGVLSADEWQTVLSWQPNPDDLMAKLRIVAEERKNYDPSGPQRVLQGSPRALFLNTEQLSLEQEVQQIRAFVG